MNKCNKPVIVGLGELLWDLLPGGKQLGGAPANFAFHTQQLGGTSYIVSMIGNDRNGTEIKNKLEEFELSDDFIGTNPDYPTGTVSVKLDKEGNPDYIIHKDVAWDQIPWNNNLKELASITDAVCFGSLAQRNLNSSISIHNFLSAVDINCLVVFDINLRQSFYTKEIIESSLSKCNILKINEDELIILSELLSIKNNEDQILIKLIENYNLELIALTRGKKGSLLFNGKEKSIFEVPPVRVCDSVGAGDSFTAALVIGQLKGLNIGDCHRLASGLSAFVCTQKGGMPILPSYIINNLNQNNEKII
ncbi:carbohydrate kinase [Bacteroidota bacterium]